MSFPPVNSYSRSWSFAVNTIRIGLMISEVGLYFSLIVIVSPAVRLLNRSDGLMSPLFLGHASLIKRNGERDSPALNVPQISFPVADTGFSIHSSSPTVRSFLPMSPGPLIDRAQIGPSSNARELDIHVMPDSWSRPNRYISHSWTSSLYSASMFGFLRYIGILSCGCSPFMSSTNPLTLS